MQISWPEPLNTSVHECDLTCTDFRLCTKTDSHAVYCFMSCGREANVVTCCSNTSFRGFILAIVQCHIINVRKTEDSWTICKQLLKSVCHWMVESRVT